MLGAGHAGLPAERLVEAYRRMALIRVFEERVSDLYRDGEVPGFVHLSIGQEASAAGACAARDSRQCRAGLRGARHLPVARAL